MSEFEKWYESWQGWHEGDYNMNKMSFEAGAQSKQAEIDELRKRIDEVLEYVGDDFNDYYTGIMIESIHEILKGTTNEQ